MEAKDLVGVVKDVGVPIAMLVWFALRVEKKLERIFEVLAEFSREVTKLVKELAETRADIRADISGVHHIPVTVRPDPKDGGK